MGVSFTLDTDFSREEVANKFALLVLAPENGREMLLMICDEIQAFITKNAEELRFHKAQLDKFGAEDKDVAASLVLLLEGANRAEFLIGQLRTLMGTLTPFGPISEEGKVK